VAKSSLPTVEEIETELAISDTLQISDKVQVKRPKARKPKLAKNKKSKQVRKK
jgi:hypothetical protein